MSTFGNLVSRGTAALGRRDVDNQTLMNLLTAFLGLAFFALILVGLILVMRRARRQRRLRDEEALPEYNEVAPAACDTRRLTIQTAGGRSSILVVGEKPMLADPKSGPTSPENIPEIHITFPEEQDEFGEKKDGRVVIVRVGETTIGLEPVKEEQLPAYEKESNQGFYSIDMDQIGGLKEKDRSQFS